MRCQYYSCDHNTIHDSDRPKGFCEIPEDVEINARGECGSYCLRAEEFEPEITKKGI